MLAGCGSSCLDLRSIPLRMSSSYPYPQSYSYHYSLPSILLTLCAYSLLLTLTLIRILTPFPLFFLSRVLQRQVDISATGEREIAHFAAGCFWSIEMAFQRVPGVIRTEVGYTQGMKKNPTYDEVCSGMTGHAEAVLVEFDTSAVTYDHLLTVFFDIHDPTTKNRQGGDVGE